MTVMTGVRVLSALGVAALLAAQPALALDEQRIARFFALMDADGNGTINSIETVSCDKDHDAEVFATYDLDADQAKDFDIDAAGSTCVAKLEENGVSFDDLTAAGNEVRPLLESDDPSEGDSVICFLRNSDGDPLDSKIVSGDTE